MTTGKFQPRFRVGREKRGRVTGEWSVSVILETRKRGQTRDPDLKGGGWVRGTLDTEFPTNQTVGTKTMGLQIRLGPRELRYHK